MGNNFFSPTAIAAIGTEISALSKVGLRIAARIPYVIGKSVLTDPKISDLRSQDRIRDILGDLIIESLAELGPFYGKLSQIALTRMGGEASELVRKSTARPHLQRLASHRDKRSRTPPGSGNSCLERLSYFGNMPNRRRFDGTSSCRKG